MSEVKRFHISGGDWEGKPHEKGEWVLAVDFDRVTAERDAVLGRVTELESSFDELATSVGFSEARLDQTGDSPIDCANQLQQRLTAADEAIENAADEFSLMSLEAGQRIDVLEGLLRETMPALDLAASAFKSAMPIRSKVRAALKPAEGGGDEG